jgi:hypothetical protein
MTNLYHLVDTFHKQVGQGLNSKPSTTISVFSQILADIRKINQKKQNTPLTKSQRKAENKLLQKQKQSTGVITLTPTEYADLVTSKRMLQLLKDKNLHSEIQFPKGQNNTGLKI